MKKSMNRMLVLLMLFVGSLSIESYGSTNFVCHVSFGRKSKQCLGFGICFISTEVVMNASLRLSDDQGTLIMDVPFATMRGYESDFSGPVITIEEQFDVSPEIQKAMGASKPLVIKEGKYKFYQNKTGYSIYFVQ